MFSIVGHEMHYELWSPLDVSRSLCEDASLLLLDCRAPELFTSAHIKGAVHVTIPTIPLRRFRKSGRLNYSLTSLLPSENLDAFRVTSTGVDVGSVVVYDTTGVQRDDTNSISKALVAKLVEDGYRAALLAGEKSFLVLVRPIFHPRRMCLCLKFSCSVQLL